MEMQSKTRVELRLKVKILFKMSNWEKDSGWSRKKNRLITLSHRIYDLLCEIFSLLSLVTCSGNDLVRVLICFAKSLFLSHWSPVVEITW